MTAEDFEGWLKKQDEQTQRWLKTSGFKPRAGALRLLPAADGSLAGVVLGAAPEAPDLWRIAGLSRQLPDGTYRLAGGADNQDAALGWALGSYVFDRYKKIPAAGKPVLVPPKPSEKKVIDIIAGAICLGRDLINTPAEDMGPTALAAAARKVAKASGARCSVTVGADLLKKKFPAIHVVGRAAKEAPRLIDLRWGDAKAPKVTLVGKGVCFDSGGLGIKPAAGMLTMKKDMGGAASVLALAHMVMQSGLKLRLRVLIPAVENAISGNAYRPMDVVKTRSGVTVEIGHTDAEGRVVLSDALTAASEEKPEMILDFATLTGAARVALGTELPALFSNSDALADGLLNASQAVDDPMWRLPLWPGYRKLIKAQTADITNSASSPFGGAITAALFLERFVGKGIDWAHIDTFGWNAATQPGRPKGGEVPGVRAAFALLSKRYR